MNNQNNDWVPRQFHCQLCGESVTAHRNSSGVFKYECSKCRTVTVQKFKGGSRATAETFFPKDIWENILEGKH